MAEKATRATKSCCSFVKGFHSASTGFPTASNLSLKLRYRTCCLSSFRPSGMNIHVVIVLCDDYFRFCSLILWNNRNLEESIFVLFLISCMLCRWCLLCFSHVRFLPARRYASAGNSDRNVSVCPSVCPSVTRRYCAKKKKASCMISSPSGSLKTLVFWRQISSPNSKGPQTRVGRKNLAIF